MSGTESWVGDPIVRLAVRDPVAVGAKRIVNEHDALAASEARLVHEPPVRVNSAAFVPVMLVVKGTAVVPPLVIVTELEVFCPTLRLPKLTVAGDAVIAATPTPVSAAEASAGEPTDSVAVAVPSAVGANCTVSVQEAPAASDASGAQEPPVNVNAAAFAPVTVVENGALAVPELLTVNVAAAVRPRMTLPKLCAPGLIVTKGAEATPVPESAAVMEPPKVRPAVSGPVVVGANRTMAVQLAPGASEATGPQEPPVSENCVALGPVIAMEKGAAAVPPLETVNVALAVCPRVTLPKLWAAGVIVTKGADATPVPESAAVTEGAKVRPAVSAPVVVGANWTMAVQLAPGASEATGPQEPPVSENCVALGPVIAMEKGSAAVPPLETVNVALAVCPRVTLPKLWAAGVIVTEEATPVPESGTVMPPGGLTARVAVIAPAAVGANRTLKLQAAPGASVPRAAQLLPAATLNCAAFAPERAVVNPMLVVPLFASAKDADPTAPTDTLPKFALLGEIARPEAPSSKSLLIES